MAGLLTELMEVIVYVEDMNAQVRFYRDTLGLKLKYAPEGDDFSGTFWLEFATGACTLALHGGGKRNFGDDAPKLVFRVKEIAIVREELLQRGVQLGQVRKAAPGVWVVDGADPEGNKFSIEEHEDTHND